MAQTLIDSIKHLPYDQRMHKASLYGSQHKDDPTLSQVVTDLLAQSTSNASVYEEEDDMVLVFENDNAVQTNYLHHQVGVAVAAASKSQVVKLAEVVKRESKFVKKLTVKELARQMKSDAELEALISSSVPSVSRQLIHACVRYRRVGVLDKIVPKLFETDEAEFATSLLHGCSHDVVARYFGTLNNLPPLENFARFHSSVLLSLLTEQLRADTPEKVWAKWSTLPVLTTNFAISLLALYDSHPMKSHRSASPLPRCINRLASSKPHIKRVVDFVTTHMKFEDGQFDHFCIDFIWYRLPSSERLSLGMTLLKKIPATHISQVNVFWSDMLFSNVGASHVLEYARFITSSLGTNYAVAPFLRRCAQSLVCIAANLSSEKKSLAKLESVVCSFLSELYLPYFEANTESELVGCARTGVDSVLDTCLSLMRNFPSKLSLLSSPLEAALRVPRFYCKDDVDGKTTEKDLEVLVHTCYLDVGKRLLVTLCDSSANKDVAAVIDSLFTLIFSHYPGLTVLPLKVEAFASEALKWVSPSVRISATDSISDAQVCVLMESSSHLLPHIPPARLFAAALELMSRPTTPESLRDDVMRWLDVTDRETRKLLHKAVDNKSFELRLKAMKLLLDVSVASKCPKEMMRTFALFHQKTKNESPENRREFLLTITSQAHKIVQIFVPSPGVVNVDSMAEEGSSKSSYIVTEDSLARLNEFRDFLLGVLEACGTDASCFGALGLMASGHISHAVKIGLARADARLLFESCAEVKWRIAVSKDGLTSAKSSFELDRLDVGLYYGQYPPEKEKDKKQWQECIAKASTVFNVLQAVYTSRLGDEWATPGRLSTIAKKFGIFWDQIPALAAHIHQTILVERLVADERDANGHYVVLEDDDAASPYDLFTSLLDLHRRTCRRWHTMQPLVDTLDVLINSNKASELLPRWLGHAIGKGDALPRKVRMQKRDAAVHRLLQISPSAIHINFVWRFLVRFRQDLLDKFLASNSSFEGLFQLSDGHTPQKTLMLQRAARFSHRRARVPVPKQYFAPYSSKSLSDVMVRQMSSMDVDLAAPSAGVGYCLPAVFGLHRLLPQQSALIGDRILSLDMNEFGIAAAAHYYRRYACLPSTTNADVLALLDRGDLKDPMTEAVLQALGHSDNPCASLEYLMSEKFLKSDFAKISIVVLAQCTRHMLPDRLSAVLSAILTGKRRNLLAFKVTVLKAVVRLLADVNNPDLMVRLWKQKSLHRDARVVILQQGLKRLKSFTDAKDNWCLNFVVDSLNCSVDDDSWVPTKLQLLTCTPSLTSASVSLTKAGGRVGKLFEVLGSLPRIQVDASLQQQYVARVVLPLASQAISLPLRAIALASLVQWLKCLSEETLKAVSELAYALLVEVDEVSLVSDNDDFAAEKRAGFQHALSIVVSIFQNHLAEDKALPPSWVLSCFSPAVSVLSTALASCKNASLYAVLEDRLEMLIDEFSSMHLFPQLPERGPSSTEEFLVSVQRCGDSLDVARQLFQPLLQFDDLFLMSMIKNVRHVFAAYLFHSSPRKPTVGDRPIDLAIPAVLGLVRQFLVEFIPRCTTRRGLDIIQEIVISVVARSFCEQRSDFSTLVDMLWGILSELPQCTFLYTVLLKIFQYHPHVALPPNFVENVLVQLENLSVAPAHRVLLVDVKAFFFATLSSCFITPECRRPKVFHRNHPHALALVEPDSSSFYSCNVCHKVFRGLAWRCTKRCGWDAHPHCVVPAQSVGESDLGTTEDGSALQSFATLMHLAFVAENPLGQRRNMLQQLAISLFCKTPLCNLADLKWSSLCVHTSFSAGDKLRPFEAHYRKPNEAESVQKAPLMHLKYFFEMLYNGKTAIIHNMPPECQEQARASLLGADDTSSYDAAVARHAFRLMESFPEFGFEPLPLLEESFKHLVVMDEQLPDTVARAFAPFVDATAPSVERLEGLSVFRASLADKSHKRELGELLLKIVRSALKASDRQQKNVSAAFVGFLEKMRSDSDPKVRSGFMSLEIVEHDVNAQEDNSGQDSAMSVDPPTPPFLREAMKATRGSFGGRGRGGRGAARGGFMRKRYHSPEGSGSAHRHFGVSRRRVSYDSDDSEE